MYLNVLLSLIFGFGNAPLGVPAKGDLCHVYLVDRAAAIKALATGKQDDEQKAQIIYPTFETAMGEELQTTKHYRIPHSKLFITASVYYTDESINPGVDNNDNSIMLGLTVTGKKLHSAIATYSNNAVTEISYDDNTNIVRVKKYITIKNKQYLIGLECDCKAKSKENDKK
jgi:hypothetical protein